MTFRLAPRVVYLSVLLAPMATGPDALALDWPSSFFSAPAEPGTASWWKKHKGKAELVVGSGYRVPGFDGFYDSKGRPIDAPVDEVVASLSDPIETPKGLLPGLDPKKNYSRVKDAVGYGPDQQRAKAEIAQADALFKERKYAQAARAYETAANRWPNSLIEERALFLLGECYFWQNKFDDARDTYDELVQKHPNTRNLDTLIERQWAIAQYWEKHYFDYRQDATLNPNFLDKTRPTFDTIGHAVKTYDSIRLNDPTGPRADDAIMATAGIYFRLKRYHDADEHYTLLRREYPRSEHQFNAHLLGLQAKLRKYQGADYDGAVLEEAKDLTKQIGRQFAGRLSSEEKDRLRQARAEVAKAIDQRDLSMAQYYDNTEHYAAAKVYYNKLAKRKSDSPLIQQSRTRLAELGDAPDQPEQRLAWFVDLFPESRERSVVNQIPELQREAQTRLAKNPGEPAETPTTTR